MSVKASKDIIPYDLADNFLNIGNWIMLIVIMFVWLLIGLGVIDPEQMQGS